MHRIGRRGHRILQDHRTDKHALEHIITHHSANTHAIATKISPTECPRPAAPNDVERWTSSWGNERIFRRRLDEGERSSLAGQVFRGSSRQDDRMKVGFLACTGPAASNGVAGWVKDWARGEDPRWPAPWERVGRMVGVFSCPPHPVVSVTCRCSEATVFAWGIA